jgi:hypothetical protein
VRPRTYAVLPAFALAAVQSCARAGSLGPGASQDGGGFDASGLGGDAAASDDGRTTLAEDAGLQQRLVLDLAASSFVASVSDRPEWPESDGGARRMGYLRNGAVVRAYDPPVQRDDCKEGWYELVGGGFVCGKVGTIDLTSPRVKLAPKAPDRDAGLPYRYGVNVSDGTPLYRRVLSAEDRRRYEPHLAASSRQDASAETEPSEKTEKSEEDAPVVVAEEPAPAPRKSGREKSEKGRRGRRKPERHQEPPRDPFHHSEGGRPQLRDLKGRGVLVRTMARGFIVALDKDFRAAGTRWWRTALGFAAPFDRIALHGPATKHVGAWFSGPDALAFVDGQDGGTSVAGTVAFVNSRGAQKLLVSEDKKGGLKLGWGGELPRRSAVLLTGREALVSSVLLHETTAGFWVRMSELKVAKPQIPEDVGENERWVDVDLTRQQLVAFEGKKPVFATLISSGRRNFEDPEHDFPTPPGVFRIREKHVTTTMDGDVASDGPYSIEDVPWVMYFQGSYALHGAFWHDAFGNMRSHGCINMSPDDARTLFAWTEPQLPDGWHGVFAKDESAGSRIVIHEDPAPGKRHMMRH